ncbi:UNVERIFIED_CONTAM: hypothetical protein K2H54_044432 [Gekko kuhli]
MITRYQINPILAGVEHQTEQQNRFTDPVKLTRTIPTFSRIGAWRLSLGQRPGRKIQISSSASQRRQRLSKDMKTEHVNNPYNFAKDLMPSLSVTLTEAIMETRLEYFSSIDSSKAAAGTSPYRGFMTPAELLGTGCIIADEIN